MDDMYDSCASLGYLWYLDDMGYGYQLKVTATFVVVVVAVGYSPKRTRSSGMR